MTSWLSVLSKSDLSAHNGPVRVLGIDLGTTNSTVAEAVWDPASRQPPRVRCLDVEQPTPEGTYFHTLVPSIVVIHEGRVWTGEGAKRLRARTGALGLEPERSLFAECKNHIGTRHTYHRAPEGFRSAHEISGRVVKMLYDAALAQDPTPPARVVVTVPASFQVAQRRATREAAALAGLTVAGGDLLDEPVAAFLDYLVSSGGEALTVGKDHMNLVVFDFGGGTCDVAVLKIQPGQAAGELTAAPLAVSRYHRLGGGDIDAAIVYEVLIPELLQQNGLDARALGFAEKKRVTEPALRGIAESLKIGLCEEIVRLQAFGKLEGADLSTIRSRLTMTHEIVLGERGQTLRLANPTLSAAQFDTLMEPFLDRDLLYARDSEYRLTCSILAPLQDALDRARIETKNVDACLLVGGSTLIPHVRTAIREFFPTAQVLTHADADGTQMAVARGAAWHALALAVSGRGLVQPVSHDVISLRTQDRPLQLVPAGVALPYPGADAPGRCDGLVVPVSSRAASVPVRVEVVAGDVGAERLLHVGTWQVPGPVVKGTRLFVEYRFDENQVLDVAVGLCDFPEGDRYSCTIENPLTHVVNPNATRMKLDEIEESIRTGAVPKDKVADKLVEAAGLMTELGHLERAFEQLARVLRAKGRPDVFILNKMAGLAGELGDAEREEKLYREAAAASPSWTGPLFNLALTQKRRRLFKDAARTIFEAMSRERPVPYLILAAQIEAALGHEQERKALLREALGESEALNSLDDWELGWLLTGAVMAKDEKLAEKAREEQRRRLERGVQPVTRDGVLPARKADWLN